MIPAFWQSAGLSRAVTTMSLLRSETPFGKKISFPGFHPGLPMFRPNEAGDWKDGGIEEEDEATNTLGSSIAAYFSHSSLTALTVLPRCHLCGM
jgi:hypothetical protein